MNFQAETLHFLVIEGGIILESQEEGDTVSESGEEAALALFLLKDGDEGEILLFTPDGRRGYVYKS
eukprot:12357398-Ditylum_brightwellii.AAC.1